MSRNNRRRRQPEGDRPMDPSPEVSTDAGDQNDPADPEVITGSAGPPALSDLVAALVRDHGIKAVRRAVGLDCGPCAPPGPGFVTADPNPDPDRQAKLVEALASLRSGDMQVFIRPTTIDTVARPSFTHPLLPGYSFPFEVAAVDAAALRNSMKAEKAVLDASGGLATAVYSRGPDGARTVLAVVTPPTNFEAE